MRAKNHPSRRPSGFVKGNCSLGNCWSKPLTPPGLKPLLFFFSFCSLLLRPTFFQRNSLLTRFPDAKLQSLTLQLHFISPQIPSSCPVEHSTKKCILPRSRNGLGVPSLTPPKFYPGSPGLWFITHRFFACLLQETFPD